MVFTNDHRLSRWPNISFSDNSAGVTEVGTIEQGVILSLPNWDAPEVPLWKIARGYVYLGPRAKLHKNTPIKGFVTDEMFKRYRRYYEIDFGRTFKNAEEVDRYFQAHRFPKP